MLWRFMISLDPIALLENDGAQYRYSRHVLFFCVQEKTGFFFCLQDRALLCRECDVSIHTANSLASNHKRFLVPGIRVALEAMVGQQAEPAAEPVVPAEEVAAAAEAVAQYTPSSRRSSTTTCDTRSPGTTANDFATTCRSSPVANPSEILPTPAPKSLQGAMVVAAVPAKSAGMILQTPINNVHLQTGNSEVWKKSSITEFLIEAVPGWRVDELLSLAEMGDGYNTSAAHDIGSPCKVCTLLHSSPLPAATHVMLLTF